MLYFIAAVIVLVLADILIRYLFDAFKEKQTRQHRQEVLDESLTIDLGREAVSLRRVKVKEPKARILNL